MEVRIQFGRIASAAFALMYVGALPIAAFGVWLGVLLMFVWFAFPRSKAFFRGESLNRETPVLVPEDPADFSRS
mgnify:CR=1 FL=1